MKFRKCKKRAFAAPLGGLMAFWLQKGAFIVGVLVAHSLKIWKKSDDNYYFLAFTENFTKNAVFRFLRRNGEISGKTEGTMSQ